MALRFSGSSRLAEKSIWSIETPRSGLRLLLQIEGLLYRVLLFGKPPVFIFPNLLYSIEWSVPRRAPPQKLTADLLILTLEVNFGIKLGLFWTATTKS